MKFVLLFIMSGCLITSVEGDPKSSNLGENYKCEVSFSCDGIFESGILNICSDDGDKLFDNLSLDCHNRGEVDCPNRWACEVVCNQGPIITPCVF